MSEFADSFHQLTASIISQLAGFLQLKSRANDQTESPFDTHPTTMLIAVSSCMLYYLLHNGLLLFPMSRFSAVEQRLLICSAYAAVSALTAAVLPDRASPFIYTIFGLLSTGVVLSVFRDKLVIGEEEEDEEEGGEASKFEVYTRRVRRFLKKKCSGAAEFFQEQKFDFEL